jgi:hypothetical protein
LSFAIAYFFSAHLHAVMAEVHRVERWPMFAGLTPLPSSTPGSAGGAVARSSRRPRPSLMSAPCIGLGTLTALRPA